MKILISLILLSFISTTITMGQYIGVYAKKDGKLCFEKPIFTEEDTELNNKLRSATHQLEELRKIVTLDDAYWRGMTFTTEEAKALKCNFVQDNADGTIEYANSSGTEIPDDFYAIKTKCNDQHCFVYDPEYLEYENWASLSTVENALGKMIKILHERIKATDNVSDYLLYDFENLNMLFGIIATVKDLYQPDEVAIIIAP